jgi:class 3 adenylate cyclase/tetratricopeptide (TPR) repeat protein
VPLPCSACGAANPEGARFCASCGAPLARACPSCGASVPEGARFCPACGAALGAEALPGGEALEERRTVSILFADLAGFTSHSDRADPEDVRRTLVPFHALAKEEIERFGGTLDKFIGDAAMGVFGAPIAHEDDPERAVRAAFAIQARADELALAVRVAVNTGEAVVAFATGPHVGENVAGDVVNTASRLQGVAPLGSIVVGASTFRATRASAEYEELEPVSVKGKAEPLRVWRAAGLRSDAPLRDEDDPPPFVGRERERALLRELFNRTVGERTGQLVTIVGDPGIGKTRLVADLAEHVRSTGQDVSWLRGRCPPYGDAVTYAPLEQVVRRVTGIMRSDDRGAALDKLAGVLRELAPTAEGSDWLRTRLAPLVGAAEEGGAGVERDESFAAWTRFLELEATRRPLVLVVEDLQWADPAMLEFLDRLAAELTRTPLLLVCTARTELFDLRPDWGGGKANASTISLSPLDDDEMRTLLQGLIARTVLALPDGSEAPLIDSAGGNPLFALEFARMLGDRGDEALASLTSEPGAPGGARVPASIHGLIAARLDALTPAQRALLQDAAVIGDPFWVGALQATASADVDVPAELRELQRRGMVRPSAQRSLEGQAEFAFSHALIRDVAYGQIPRARRSERHHETVRWLAGAAAGRLDDLAERLAFHAWEALRLARAAGLPGDRTPVEDDARRFLKLAGDRETALDLEQAATSYRRALDLAPPGHEDRPLLLQLWTSVAWRAGRIDAEQAVATYREALEGALAAQDRHLAARVMRRLYFQLGLQGDTTSAREILDRAIALLEGDEPSSMLAELYACRAEDEMFAGRTEDSLRWADRALELPQTEFTRLIALHIRGNARCEMGDVTAGMDDLWAALRQAEETGTALDVATCYSYLAEWVGLTEGPAAGLELNRAGIETCERRGIRGQAMWSRAESLWLLYDVGDWDEVVERSTALAAWGAEHGDSQVETVGRSYEARVRIQRGQTREAARLIEAALPDARRIEDLQILAPSILVAIQIAAADGDRGAARDLLDEYDAVTADGPVEYREVQCLEAVRCALALGEPELARRLIRDRPVHHWRARAAVEAARALLVEAAGDAEAALAGFLEAGARWAEHGCRPEHAHAMHGEARCLRRAGDDAEADRISGEADAIFASLGIASIGD